MLIFCWWLFTTTLLQIPPGFAMNYTITGCIQAGRTGGCGTYQIWQGRTCHGAPVYQYGSFPLNPRPSRSNPVLALMTVTNDGRVAWVVVTRDDFVHSQNCFVPRGVTLISGFGTSGQPPTASAFNNGPNPLQHNDLRRAYGWVGGATCTVPGQRCACAIDCGISVVAGGGGGSGH